MFAPLADAIRKLNGLTPVGSALRTRDWEELVPAEIRDQALLSAGVESERVMQEMQRKLLQAVSQERQSLDEGGVLVGREEFVYRMRKVVADEGLGTGEGGLTDISSNERLRLIYDTQMDRAHAYARHKVGQDPDMLDAFPAQELVRLESREKPRNWEQRWTAAGGVIRAGRMVALKSDPVWSKLSRFGQPFPPFDFNSGMGVEDVSRSEAEQLGLLKPGQPVEPAPDTGMGEPEVAAVGEAGTKRLRNLFGDQLLEQNGRLRLDRDPVGKLLTAAQTRETAREGGLKMNLGTAWAGTVEKARQSLGEQVDLSGYSMELAATDVRHMLGRHGEPDAAWPGSGEKDLTRHEPLTEQDIRMIPQIWRGPDSVQKGGASSARYVQPEGWPSSIAMAKEDGDTLWLATYVIDQERKVLRAATLYKRKRQAGNGSTADASPRSKT